jgi:ribosomal protein S12 methylthiotransferase accessory factor
VDAETKPFGAVRGFVSRDARTDLEWIFDRLEAAGCERLLVADYTVPEIRPARVVRAIVPGLETINPFFVGLRARSALLADLLPPTRLRKCGHT